MEGNQIKMEGNRIQMERSLRHVTKKLALWFTRTFKPIMTHDELEPIMATLGFVGLPPSSNVTPRWKEYAYLAGSWRSNPDAPPPPRPRLPYPRIDGLHVYTYRAFLDSLNFYLHLPNISDLFQIRYSLLFQISNTAVVQPLCFLYYCVSSLYDFVLNKLKIKINKKKLKYLFDFINSVIMNL
jgi:hypothetical protein